MMMTTKMKMMIDRFLRLFGSPESHTLRYSRSLALRQILGVK